MLNVKVLRDGKTVELQIIPQLIKDTMGYKQGQIGAGVQKSEIKIPQEYQKTVVYEPIPALGQAVYRTYDLSAMTLKSMGKMLNRLDWY